MSLALLQVCSIHAVAHSLGANLLAQAMLPTTLRVDKAHTLIFAPADVLQRNFVYMMEQANMGRTLLLNISLLVSENDEALKFSRAENRAEWGSRAGRCHLSLCLSDDFTTINCSAASCDSKHDAMRHSYVYSDEGVAAEMRSMFLGRPLDLRLTGQERPTIEQTLSPGILLGKQRNNDGDLADRNCVKVVSLRDRVDDPGQGLL